MTGVRGGRSAGADLAGHGQPFPVRDRAAVRDFGEVHDLAGQEVKTVRRQEGGDVLLVECAPGIGWAEASATVTRSTRPAIGVPCHGSPSIARVSSSISRAASDSMDACSFRSAHDDVPEFPGVVERPDADIPSLRELAGEQATYFDPDADPASVASAMNRCFSSPVYELRIRVRTGYAWQRLYRLHIEPLLAPLEA